MAGYGATATGAGVAVGAPAAAYYSAIACVRACWISSGLAV